MSRQCEKCSNTEFFWSVFSCIRTEYRKIRTRKNSVFGHFLRSADTKQNISNNLFKSNVLSRLDVLACVTHQSTYESSSSDRSYGLQILNVSMSQLCLNMSAVPSSPDYMSQVVPLKLRRYSSIHSTTVQLSHEISCKINT